MFKKMKKKIEERMEENSTVLEDRLNEAIMQLASDIILSQREYKAICELLYAMQYEDIPLHIDTLHKLNLIRSEQGIDFPAI